MTPSTSPLIAEITNQPIAESTNPPTTESAAPSAAEATSSPTAETATASSTDSTPPTTVTHFADISCIVNGGASVALLRRMASRSSDEALCFNLKFYSSTPEGKKTALTNGIGVPIYLRLKSFHESRGGCQIIGTIVKFNPKSTDSMRIGYLSNPGYRKIPHEWFSPGNEIHFIHRGAGAAGMVFTLINPTTQHRLKLLA